MIYQASHEKYMSLFFFVFLFFRQSYFLCIDVPISWQTLSKLTLQVFLKYNILVLKEYCKPQIQGTITNYLKLTSFKNQPKALLLHTILQYVSMVPGIQCLTGKIISKIRSKSSRNFDFSCFQYYMVKSFTGKLFSL